MRILCLLLVGTFVLSKVDAENSIVPIRRFHGYGKSIVESDARSLTGGSKSSAKQTESYQKGRDVRAKRYSRVTIGPMGYRKTIKTQLPLQSGEQKKFMGSTRLNSSHRRSLDDGYSIQNSLKQSQYSHDHKEVSNVIHLEPVVDTVARNGVFDWMVKFLSRFIGYDKIRSSKIMTPVKNFGPLLGPVDFPGIGSNVYIRQFDPIQEEADHVVIHLVEKVQDDPHESPMRSAVSLLWDSLVKPTTIQSPHSLLRNASVSSYKISLPANHRNTEKNTSDVNTLEIKYSNVPLLQNIRRQNFLLENTYLGLHGGKNFIPRRPYESHEYHSAISIIQPPSLRQTANNIREEMKGSSYSKDGRNMMTVSLGSSKKIQNLPIYPSLPAMSEEAEVKAPNNFYPMHNILSEESQIIRTNRIVASSKMNGGLKVVMAPNLNGGSQSNFENSANYVQKTDTVAPVNYSGHNYVNKESLTMEKSAVRNDNAIIGSTSSIMENVTHKSTPSVVIVTPNYPWRYDKTRERLQQDIKPVYEIPNDYEDHTLKKSYNITSKSIDKKLITST